MDIITEQSGPDISYDSFFNKKIEKKCFLVQMCFSLFWKLDVCCDGGGGRRVFLKRGAGGVPGGRPLRPEHLHQEPLRRRVSSASDDTRSANKRLLVRWKPKSKAKKMSDFRVCFVPK